MNHRAKSTRPKLTPAQKEAIYALSLSARQKLYPGIKDNANPDLTTAKYGYIDVKSPHNKSNIVSNANSACTQGAIAVLTDLSLEKEEISIEELNKFSERVFPDITETI